MERKEVKTLVNQFRVVWSFKTQSGFAKPFVILQFRDEKDYKDFWELEDKDRFLAERLAGRTIYIPDEEAEDGYDVVRIPSYYTEDGYKDLFWIDNIYETFEEAYQRIYENMRKHYLEMWLYWPIEEIRKEVSIDMIEEQAKEVADAFFTDLPVVEL
jgi:hypothetical protein